MRLYLLREGGGQGDNCAFKGALKGRYEMGDKGWGIKGC
jgi:hypothetical protein